MGADLYLIKKYKKQKEKYEPLFNEAVKKRDNAPDHLKDKAQEKVNEYYYLMYSEGYFRDSYNDSNLLWQFGLDYWNWFGDLLDENSNLTPDQAQIVLDSLKQNENIFESKLIEISEENQKYFRDKYSQFKTFLTEAITTNEPISCSI
jgi:hypothetical protein